MQLIYNGVDLATIGTLRILGRTTAREPAEAPQRERVSYRLRLDFFQQTFSDNFTLLQQLLAAFKTQQATLLWNDGAADRENRTVTVAADELPEDVMTRGGTYWQGVTFSFWYFNHDVTSNCLNATAFGLDLGAVETWKEGAQVARFDELHPQRRREEGTVTSSGRYQGNTTADLNTRRAALQALKDAMVAALVRNAEGSLAYGTFNRAVRIVSFTADVDQPHNYIAWNLSAAFTRYPDEADYALLEYQLTPRENLAEGIPYFTLSGTIRAATGVAAHARLALLQASVQPAGYVTLNLQTSERTMGSESDGAGDGVAFIELSFSFELRDPSTLPCTYQRTGVNTPNLDLGTVDKFRDSYITARFDDLRDVRKRQSGGIVVGGKWFAADGLSDADKTAALIARKAQLDTELVLGSSGQLVYTTVFNQRVRIVNFTAEINRLVNCVEWTLTAEFTRYPDESDYALLEVRVQTRLHKPENITYLNLSGKLGAPTESAARARLALLTGSLVPSGYASVINDVTAATVTSESAGGGDGTAFTELAFNLEYRDSSTVSCHYQRSGVNTPNLDLGTVDRFSDRYATTLFDEMRNQRRREAGQVSISGKWFVSDALDAAAQQAALTDRLAQLQAELKQGSSGQLAYGSVFNQTVRVVDFHPAINRFSNCVEWDLTAGYTAFPNESDYAMCEFRLGTRNNLTEGTVFKTLAGEIWAPTPGAAQSKLAGLRSALIPTGYAMTRDNTGENRVDVESSLQTTGVNQGEGPTFIRLTVDEEWQAMTPANITTWTLRVATEDDSKTSFVRTVYSGSVTAGAADQPTAFAAAAAQASTLGAGQEPFVLRSVITENERLFQTAGAQVFVTVDYSYEYQAKGARTYLEVSSELAVDNYGQTVETVTGTIVAPTLAVAQASYIANVRNATTNTGALVLSERTPTKSYQRLDDGTGNLSTLDDRFTFNLQLLRAKDAAATAVSYTLAADSNVQAMEVATVVEGQIYASTEAVARAFLDTFLGTQTLPGKRTEYSRTPEYRQGPAIGGGAPGSVFLALRFKDVYVSLLTGVTGILESEVTEDVQYSGTRNVVKGIPDGNDIVQQVGIVSGQRSVTAHCKSTTSAAAQAWARTIRSALLASVAGGVQAYEQPPRVRTGYAFLPQIAGVPSGTGANVKLFELDATFSEILPDYGFIP